MLEKPKGREVGRRQEIKQSKLIRDEAFQYLVILFTEDQSMSAKDIYAFPSVRVAGLLHDAGRVAESYYNQNGPTARDPSTSSSA